MNVAPCRGGHVITLSAFEAGQLMDACALIILSAEAEPAVSLPPELAATLSDLFIGLQDRGAEPTPIDRYRHRRSRGGNADPDPTGVDPSDLKPSW